VFGPFYLFFQPSLIFVVLPKTRLKEVARDKHSSLLVEGDGDNFSRIKTWITRDRTVGSTDPDPRRISGPFFRRIFPDFSETWKLEKDPFGIAIFISNRWHCFPALAKETFYQGILKGKVSLYCWPPVWLVWNQPYDNWQFLFLFAKQTNINQSNRRSTVQWYFPL